MAAAAKYECETCEGTGQRIVDGETKPCDDCDGIGVTAIDCPACHREAVPIHETVFVAAYPETYCEPCGDRELAKIAARRGEVTR